MGTILVSLSILLLYCILCIQADVFWHNPRGSNNWLNEDKVSFGYNVNARRLFSSSNDGAGGYRWGPAMKYVEGSELQLEWTSTHTTSNGQATSTEIIQYMCTPSTGQDVIRDGVRSTTIPNSDTYNDVDSNGSFLFGMHENRQYYQECENRTRNKGLFTGTRNLQKDRATTTRANVLGTAFGFECSEERDYYPYWHPSPWKDIIVLTSEEENCPFYQAESQNVKAKNFCTNVPSPVPNNEIECISAGGQWTSKPAHNLPPPSCLSSSSASQYPEDQAVLGDIRRYKWNIPDANVACGSTSCNCVLRIRYNLTSEESEGLTGEFLDYRNNAQAIDNPIYTVDGLPLQIALTSLSLGRAFQDRSHMFQIIQKPSDFPSSSKIHNLNVRGRRGSFVNTFPATSYEFVPSPLSVKVGDYIHFQWTGSDFNPSGVSGNGMEGTDRSNIVQISDLNSNFPADIVGSGNIVNHLFEDENLRHHMGYIGQTQCKTKQQLQSDSDNNGISTSQNTENCFVLNSANTPYFDGGIIKMNKTGTFYFMNTRNNYFSNRFQKGTIIVQQ